MAYRDEAQAASRAKAPEPIVPRKKPTPEPTSPPSPPAAKPAPPRARKKSTGDDADPVKTLPERAAEAQLAPPPAKVVNAPPTADTSVQAVEPLPVGQPAKPAAASSPRITTALSAPAPSTMMTTTSGTNQWRCRRQNLNTRVPSYGSCPSSSIFFLTSAFMSSSLLKRPEPTLRS